MQDVGFVTVGETHMAVKTGHSFGLQEDKHEPALAADAQEHHHA